MPWLFGIAWAPSANAGDIPAVSGVTATTPAVSSETPTVTLAAVGDIRLNGPVGNIIDRDGPGAPTAAVRGDLRADIVFGNLECSVTKRGDKVSKKFNFRAPSAHLSALKAAGFHLINLANNHTMDFGPLGILDTLASLDKAGFKHIGAGKNLAEATAPVIVSTRGVRIGFIGWTSTFPEEAWAGKHPGVAYSDYDRFPEAIRRAKQLCDVLVVSFHGGTELADDANDIQRSFAHAAVDAGADIVIGHHPHVIQPVEIYKGRFILYSIGNFMFVSPTPTTRWSVIVRAAFTREGVAGIEFVPVDTWYGRIHPASAEGVRAVRAALNRRGALDRSPLLKVRM